MRGHAALLLVLVGALIAPSLQRPEDNIIATTPKPISGAKSLNKGKNSISTTTPKPLDIDDVLLQDSKTSLDDPTNSEKVQEEIARLIKAQARKPVRPKQSSIGSTSSKISSNSKKTPPIWKDVYNSTDTKTLEAILRHGDATYNDSTDNEQDDEDEDDDEEDDDDEYDEDEDEEEDEDDDEDEEDEDDDDANDDDDTISECPDYCRCSGEYATVTTARCKNLLEDQVFGSNIAHLQIDKAGDIRLGPGALKKIGLKQLQTLVIVDTKIVELDPLAFEGLKKLFVVNLTRNGLTYIHPHTFKDNTEISLLTISGNPLRLSARKVQEPDGSRSSVVDYILDAPNVVQLDLSHNELYRLPRRAFVKMPNLVKINLKRNRFGSVERELFKPLENLEDLDLSHNLLSDLPSALFTGTNLQTLKLAGNTLTGLSSIKAPKLTTLDASMNQLKIIKQDDLAGVPYLDRLYLNSNNLMKINAHAFANLDQLTHLDLSNNNLMKLNEHHFKANSRLQVLLLNDNPDLESLPTFRTNAQEFERYSIYQFECENCGLTYIERGTFDAMPAMIRLNLARNQLSFLPAGLLSSLSSLRDLDLSMNRIDKLEDDIFEGASSLNKLSLAKNSFVNGLPVTPFLKTPNLSRLDLSYCSLQRIWNNITVPFESLRFLSLYKNRLTRIRIEELRAMPKLSGLDVSRNPLKCDGEMSKAIQWLTEHGVTPTEYFHGQGGSSRNSEPYESVTQWTDLAKKQCDKWELGPPPRLPPRRPSKKTQMKLADGKISMPEAFVKTSREEIIRKFGQPINFDDDYIPKRHDNFDVIYTEDSEYNDIERPEELDFETWWKEDNIWPAIAIVLLLVGVLLATAHVTICLAKRRGRGPVIRTSMILRPGLIDNKNCGLVYKPLQEEIPTPHAPKRSSFYSSSTFHYDKIVPESV